MWLKCSKIVGYWSKSLKRQLWLRENKRCFWCGRGVILKGQEPRSATIDHLIPKAHGGSNSHNNLIMACKRCNNSRGSKGTKKTIKWLANLLRRKR